MSFASASSLVAGTTDVPGDAPYIVGSLDGDQILIPLLTSDVPALTDQLRVAASLARTTDASLHVVDPITAPYQMPMEQRQDVPVDDEKALLEWAIEQVSTASSQVESRFLHTHRIVDRILQNVAANDIDTLVVPSNAGPTQLRQSLAERLAIRAECDVIIVNGQRGYEQVPSILLAVAGGPHSGLAIDIAERIATDCDAWIDILHVVDEDASTHQRQQAEAYVEAAYQRITRPESTTTWILEAEDVAETIIEQSSYYRLTIIGAPTTGRLQQFIFGSTNQTIRNNAHSVILSARNNQATS